VVRLKLCSRGEVALGSEKVADLQAANNNEEASQMRNGCLS
jgi:hypothetical protein